MFAEVATFPGLQSAAFIMGHTITPVMKIFDRLQPEELILTLCTPACPVSGSTSAIVGLWRPTPAKTNPPIRVRRVNRCVTNMRMKILRSLRSSQDPMVPARKRIALRRGWSRVQRTDLLPNQRVIKLDQASGSQRDKESNLLLQAKPHLPVPVSLMKEVVTSRPHFLTLVTH